MQESYDEGVTDEFIKPSVNGGFDGTIKEGDVVIFVNYRCLLYTSLQLL